MASTSRLRETLASEGLVKSGSLNFTPAELTALIWAVEEGRQRYNGLGAFSKRDLDSALDKLYGSL